MRYRRDWRQSSGGKLHHIEPLALVRAVFCCLGIARLSLTFAKRRCCPGDVPPVLSSTVIWSPIRGMSVPDAKRLKELETENGRLKKLLAESMLENQVIREAQRKKW